MSKEDPQPNTAAAVNTWLWVTRDETNSFVASMGSRLEAFIAALVM